MSAIRLSRVTGADAADIIAANRESQAHHRPWVSSFTDQAGFDAWCSRSLTGAHVGLVAREAISNGIVGVINLNEIVTRAFQRAYLGYWGMVGFRRRASRRGISRSTGNGGITSGGGCSRTARGKRVDE
jgi:[ribosomal protein S5]-alanine N-acetyltransferase